MSNIKNLVKDTTVYGLSSILARTLNFLLLPVYTRVLSKGEFGLYSEIFTYIAVLQVVLIFGMETGFFRYASLKEYDSKKVFSTISGFLAAVSLIFFISIYFLSDSIGAKMGYYPLAMIYAAGILSIDCFTSVFFARLRYERKAMKFAVYRSIKICSEILFNLLFLFLLPKYFVTHTNSVLLNFFTPEVSYVYVLAAVFCSALVSLVIFIPDIIKTKYQISFQYLKVIFIYSFPLMLAGLQGILGDFIDRPLFRFLAPEGELTWNEQLGEFTASARLAVIMSLFIQMFRYAAEPFFFSESSKTDIKPVYARVMKYFTIFCVIVFLFISYYAGLLQYLLGKDFRAGMIILPIMLMAYLLSGINQNLSMWYKLVSKTKIAIFITFCGLMTSVLVNVIFMPKYSYMAAAWSHVASYLVMLLVSWNLSKKYYKIPYQWGSIITYILLGVAMFMVSKLIETNIMALNLLSNTILLGLFIYFVYRKERLQGMVTTLIKRIKK